MLDSGANIYYFGDYILDSVVWRSVDYNEDVDQCIESIISKGCPVTHDNVQKAVENGVDYRLIEKLISKVEGPVILKPSSKCVERLPVEPEK